MVKNMIITQRSDCADSILSGIKRVASPSQSKAYSPNDMVTTKVRHWFMTGLGRVRVIVEITETSCCAVRTGGREVSQ